MYAILRRKALIFLGTALTVVALGAASWPDLSEAVRGVADGLAYATTRDATDGSDVAEAREVARIRAHFDSVLVELRAPVARPLTPAQRAARARHIARLQAYSDRGIYPHNHDFRGQRVPYFVDHRGVHCAVGHLLRQSGRSDIVGRVRATDNHVRVAALAGDAAFASWLDASGLTLAEAARIQPWYGELPPEEPRAERNDNARIGAALASSALSTASIVWNARSRSSARPGMRAALGYTAAVLGIAVAIDNRDAGSGAKSLGIASGTLGVGSAAMATRTLVLRRRAGGPAAPSVARKASAPALTFAPAMLATGGRRAPGVTMNLRF